MARVVASKIKKTFNTVKHIFLQDLVYCPLLRDSQNMPLRPTASGNRLAPLEEYESLESRQRGQARKETAFAYK